MENDVGESSQGATFRMQIFFTGFILIKKDIKEIHVPFLGFSHKNIHMDSETFKSYVLYYSAFIIFSCLLTGEFRYF